MTHSPPEISVLMAVHNGDEYLKDAIDSVLGQEFEGFEFVIIDDASKDRSAEIVAKAAATDHRIRTFQNEENIGLTRSLNIGLGQARASFIARMDADDICTPDRLSVQLEAMKQEPELTIVGSGCRLIDGNGNEQGVISERMSPRQAEWFLSLAPVCYHPTYFFKRMLPDGAPVMYDSSFVTAQDYDLWSRLALVGPTRVLPDLLLHYRRHGKGISSTKRAEQAQNAKMISLRNLGRRLDTEELAEIAPLVESLSFERGSEASDIKLVVKAAERLIRKDENLFSAPGERKWMRQTVAALTADGILSRSKAIRKPISLVAFLWYARRLLLPLLSATIAAPSKAKKSLFGAFKIGKMN